MAYISIARMNEGLKMLNREILSIIQYQIKGSYK